MSKKPSAAAPVVEITDSLRTRVFLAAKDGMAFTLFALLADLPSATADQLLQQLMEEEDGQKSTPLIIAARHGRDRVVKLLLSKFKINLEQEGIVKFDGYKVEGATALWCAAGAGHLRVVKTLVKAKANVDHPTKTNSTPLRAACFDGRLDIVRYLAEHSANIHTANKYNNTCLMVASFRVRAVAELGIPMLSDISPFQIIIFFGDRVMLMSSVTSLRKGQTRMRKLSVVQLYCTSQQNAVNFVL